MKRALALLLVLCLVGAATSGAQDVVTKTDGAKLRGQVIVDGPDGVKIKTAGGVIDVPRNEVSSVQRSNDVFRELKERKAKLETEGDARGWLELGRWCQDKELQVPAVDCFHAVLRLDKDNEDARFELGYRRLGEKWVTEGEYFRAKGYIPYEGRWVTKEDKDNLDRGLVNQDGQWLPKDMAAAREKEAEAEREHERQGIPGAGAKPPATPAPRVPISPLGKARDHANEKPLAPDERKAAVEAEKAKHGWKLAWSSRHYDFFSNGSSLDEVKALASTMDLMCDEYKKIFAYKDDLVRPFPVWLYGNQQEFMEQTGHGPGVGGYYDGEKIVGFHGNLASLTPQIVLFHEGTHQFEGLVFGKNLWTAKIWFVEGLAVYFESSEVAAHHLTTDVIPRERLAAVQRAIRSGDYVHLSDLIRLDQRQFGALHYAHAWSLIYFLCHGTKGGLERFKKYFDGVKEGKDGVKLFEELFNKPISEIEDAWKQYVLDLR